MGHDHSSLRTSRRARDSKKKRDRQKRESAVAAKSYRGAEKYKLVTPDGVLDILGFKENGGITEVNNNTRVYKPGYVIVPRGDYYPNGAYPTLNGKLPKDYLSIGIFGSNGMQVYIRKDVLERLTYEKGIVYAGPLSYFVPPEKRIKL